MKRCIIIGAAEFNKFDFELNENDFVIAADGGLDKCNKLNIKPDMIVGDFDSLGYIPEKDNIVVLPTMKDVTDMHKSVNIGLENKCDEFHIFGGTGGRIDHTFANVALIADLSQKGYKGYIYSDIQTITAVTDNKIEFDNSKKGFVSIFSFTDESVVSETGLKYTLDKYTLKNNFALGVSNEFIGVKSEISVYGGTVIIVY